MQTEANILVFEATTKKRVAEGMGLRLGYAQGAMISRVVTSVGVLLVASGWPG